MKDRIHRINKIGIMAALTLLAVQAFGQAPPNPADTNAVLKTQWLTFYQGVESNKSIYVALYPEYAPSITVNGKKDTFGAGLALVTEADAIPGLAGTIVGKHVFGGLRFDYLAHEAFASTLGVGLKGDVQLWSHNFSGYIEGGGNLPFAGFGVKNGDLGGMLGAGAYTSVWQPSKNVSLGLQVTVERWTQFPGEVFLGGPVFHVTF